MSKLAALSGLIVAAFAFAFAGACDSTVEATGNGGAGSGGSQLDQGCYDDCVTKGATPEECTAYCTSGTGGKTGVGGKGGSTTSTPGTAGGGGGFDEPLEKSCIACWDDNANGSCSAQYETCEKSLACTQLRNCPFFCVVNKDCIEECNAIIPTGVAPLTALVQCMACSGGPCEQECQDSVTQFYCN